MLPSVLIRVMHTAKSWLIQFQQIYQDVNKNSLNFFSDILTKYTVQSEFEFQQQNKANCTQLKADENNFLLSDFVERQLLCEDVKWF